MLKRVIGRKYIVYIYTNTMAKTMKRRNLQKNGGGFFDFFFPKKNAVPVPGPAPVIKPGPIPGPAPVIKPGPIPGPAPIPAPIPAQMPAPMPAPEPVAPRIGDESPFNQVNVVKNPNNFAFRGGYNLRSNYSTSPEVSYRLLVSGPRDNIVITDYNRNNQIVEYLPRALFNLIRQHYRGIEMSVNLDSNSSNVYISTANGSGVSLIRRDQMGELEPVSSNIGGRYRSKKSRKSRKSRKSNKSKK